MLQNLDRPMCLPVAQGFSEDASETRILMDPLSFPDALELGDQVAATVVASRYFSPKQHEDNQVIPETMRILGCKACQLADVCLVKESFIKTAAKENSLKDIQELIETLKQTPDWLWQVRSSTYSSELKEIISAGPEAISDAFLTGKLDKEMLDAGYSSRFIGYAKATDISGLNGINIVKSKKDKYLEKFVISSSRGNGEIEVIDATDIVNLDSTAPAPTTELGRLYQKLAEKICANDQKGNSQILHPDSTIQKTLRTQPDNGGAGRLDEIRMSGKNRLYCIVSLPENNGDLPRVIILGSTGGDPAEQNKCISAMTGK